jgi:hypothetical protein
MVLAAASGGLADAADETTVGAAYLAFACALAVWGWHEMSFLMGVVTGPRRTPCPEGCRGWRRFGLAVQTCIYHDGDRRDRRRDRGGRWARANRSGPGVPRPLGHAAQRQATSISACNLSEDWLPEHLGHLKSF